MKLAKMYFSIVDHLQPLRDIPLLATRLALAYGFYNPAMMKLNNIGSIVDWFESMGLPFPLLNAYMAAYTEGVGVVMLALGLGIRFISLPLMVVMIVAIKTVHWENGFEAGENGFEIPLYYFLMLLTLFIYGGGRISIDNLINRFFGSKQEIVSSR